MKNISFYNAVEKIKGLIQKSRKYGFKGFNFKNQDAYASMIFKTLDIVRVFEKYDENAFATHRIELFMGEPGNLRPLIE